MKNKIIPRGQYILIKPDTTSDYHSDSGIVLPANEEREQKAQGEVVAVSADILSIKKGDKVIYGAYAGEVLNFREGGKTIEYKLVHNDDVIAFIKNV